MKFPTQYDRVRIFSNPGDSVKVLYGASYDEKGRVILEEKGTENLYDYIQSFAESVDIHVLLKRFSNGEVDVLSKVQGFYGDITGLPTTYADLLNTVNEGEAFFNGLPVEVRSKFGHSFAQFMSALSDGSAFDTLGIANPFVEQQDPTVVPEAVENLDQVKKEVAAK